MIDQDGIVRAERAVVFAVDDELVAMNDYHGVAARSETVDQLLAGRFGLFRRRDGGSVTVGDGDLVRTNGGLDAAEEEVIGAAAGRDDYRRSSEKHGFGKAHTLL